ncbi:carboxypeptidase-like regulatory domain-containing protein [Sinomicrobium pectinilyticum]|uniref:Carboxypeptidase-like regulatory domain-containing protein n=1 Tax=Sinomicrobium pectinilyticum TaxID=1084421 RepID=A0A3N0DR47_SINP1|nr:carboxypeptidase-like regulatory domain-containing protein [Sinomicrobium pectinilyticum]RNL78097.1 carboxypeptidase-like regulatory domain-containing protein [Sinomicrobium pectinilyticum]
MRKIIPFIITIFFTVLCFSQEADKVKGVVFNTSTDRVMDNVHVVNLNQVVGTVSNPQGEFRITASVNDTLYFSFLGFKSIKVRVTNDMLKFDGTRIGMTELAYALEEVVIRPYKLTGYLDIDAKNIPINNAGRYSISGLPKGYEAGSANPGAISKVLGAIFNPVDFLHNMFGKKPKEMRKLRKMKEDDEIRNLLASKFDRETLTELLQIDRVDIDEILRNCNYSKDFIRTANDLQILDAIHDCYEEYKVLNRVDE